MDIFWSFCLIESQKNLELAIYNLNVELCVEENKKWLIMFINAYNYYSGFI